MTISLNLLISSTIECTVFYLRSKNPESSFQFVLNMNNLVLTQKWKSLNTHIQTPTHNHIQHFSDSNPSFLLSNLVLLSFKLNVVTCKNVLNLMFTQ